MSLIQKAISGFKWSGFATGYNAILSTISLIFLSRLLSPEDFGLFGMTTVVIGLVNTFRDFGLTDSVVYSQDTNRNNLSSLYWANMLISWACFIAVWLLTPLAVMYYNEPRIIGILRWSGVYFLIVPIGQQFNGLLRKDLRFKTRSLLQVFDSTIGNSSSIILALLGMGVMSLVWSTLIRGVMSAGVLLLIAAKSNWLPAFRLNIYEIKGFVKFGFYYTLQKSVKYFSTNIDYLLIGRFLGADALGYYTLAYNLVRVPASYLSPLINSVAFPSFARLQNRIEIMRKGYYEIIRYLTVVLVPALGGLFAVAPLFIPIFYGEKWESAIPIVQVFCILGFVTSLIDNTDNILYATGRTDIGFGLSVLSVIGFSFFNWFGLRWGIIGVAVSSTLFTLFILWPVDFIVRRNLIESKVHEYFKLIFNRILAGLIMMFFVLLVGNLTKELQTILSLILQIIIGGISFVLLLWIMDKKFFFEARNMLFKRSVT